MSKENLLNKIDKGLKGLCEEKKISRVEKLLIVVDKNSEVDNISIYNHLKNNNPKILSGEVEVEIRKEDIGKDTAIINCIQVKTHEEQ